MQFFPVTTTDLAITQLIVTHTDWGLINTHNLMVTMQPPAIANNDGNYTVASHSTKLLHILGHNFKASNRAGDVDSWNNNAKAFIGDHDNASFTRDGANKIMNSGALTVSGNSSNYAPK